MQDQILRGGRVLVHEDNSDIRVVDADILIRDGKIAKLGSNIEVQGPHNVLDCTGKIISPGFIDTHHHVWQTQLKGMHADQTLLEYLPCGNNTGCLFEPDDVFYGQLAGQLEALNGGITTVLDFSTINYSAQHVYAAIQASEVSGIRSVYAYCITPRSELKDDGTFQSLDLLPPWAMENFDRLATDQHKWARTSLGFAFDGLYLPQQVLKPLFDRVWAAGVRVYTCHDNSTVMLHNKPSAYEQMIRDGLTDHKGEASYVMVHSTKLHDRPAADVARNRFFNSITPGSDLSMGMGTPVPVAFNKLEYSHAQPQISLGVDCHTFSESFMPGLIRAQLFAVRQYTHAQAEAQNKWYASMHPKHEHFASVQDAFNMATLNGARALGKEKEIGSIRQGYRADLVIWDTMSPSMLAAAQEHPVAAIVIHSQPGDISGVMVDGVLRKWDGKLLPVDVSSPVGELAGYKPPVQGPGYTWSQLAKQVIKSQDRIMPLVKKIDMARSAAGVAAAFHLNQGKMIDPVTNW